jgi:integrase
MSPKRALIAKGIYRDASGVAIVVSVHGQPREFRKTEQGESYATWERSALIIERKRIDARDHLKAERIAVKAHTLAADVESYLKTLSGRTKDDADDLLAHWLTAFGDTPRKAITSLDLQQHAATWKCAASTYNHRRQALIGLYKALDGKAAVNPVRELPKRQESHGAPKALPYAVIRAVFDKMPESQSRARLKVMAYTGLPQMQIEKLTAEDWQGKRLRVTPRRKGTGTAGRWLPLSVEAIDALKEFARWDCWGKFSRSSLHKRWKRYGPKGSNPYSLRHSWITELYRRSKGDVLAVKQLALHSRLEQTERYAAAALEDRMAALVLTTNPYHDDRGEQSKKPHNTPPGNVGSTAATQRQTTRKSSKQAQKHWRVR